MKHIFDLLIYFSSLITSLSVISGIILKIADKKLKKIIEPLRCQIHKMDVKECRRFLIDFMSDVESGIKKDEVQLKFAYEVYDHYTNDLNENSYVKDKWERVILNGYNE